MRPEAILWALQMPLRVADASSASKAPCPTTAETTGMPGNEAVERPAPQQHAVAWQFLTLKQQKGGASGRDFTWADLHV